MMKKIKNAAARNVEVPAGFAAPTCCPSHRQGQDRPGDCVGLAQ